MIFIVMGPQGSGKSTQAAMLAKEYKIPHLQTGELFRTLIDRDGALGEELSKYVDSGKLVPDDLLFSVLEKELKRASYKEGFVLDGTPRVLDQAKALSFVPDAVVYLKISDKEGIKRLVKRAKIENRADDTPEAIRKRLSLYHQKTIPVLNYYKKLGVLVEIDGERPIEAIFEDILGRLKELGK